MATRSVADCRAHLVAAYQAGVTAEALTDWAVRAAAIPPGDAPLALVTIELELAGMSDPMWAEFTVRLLAPTRSGRPDAGEQLLDVAVDLVDKYQPSDVAWSPWSTPNRDDEKDLWVLERTVRVARDWPPI